MSRRITLAAAAGLAVVAASSVGAQAQTLYLGGEGGWNVLEDQRDRGPAGTANVRARFDDGYAAGAKVGYEMGPWRFEEEYTFRHNDLTNLRIGGFNAPNASGSRESHAVMTNVLYDINPASFGMNLGLPITPHIGAGVGAVNVSDNARVAGRGRLFNDDDWVFGYQAIGGIRYNVTPNVALDLDYRYLGTTDATFRVPGTGARYKSGYENHTLMAGLVYRFGPPPPPPVAAPPAPPMAAPVAAQRTFIVFFDWDKATITQEGQQIIRQAADAYRSGAPVRIQVTGYTDRSGSPGYNQRLSERRANAVAAALVRFGVARDQMAVSGRGENDNRVPTAAGVREPQNRRVEIVFS
jgi:outer membrane protein OmpA-like peptidoglycan-associated protein